MTTLYDNIPQLGAVNRELRSYVEQEIFPRYAKFFSHGINHIYNVVGNALMLAEYYHKDFDIVYTAAACHDLGLKQNREHHELASGEIIAQEKGLRKFFAEVEIQLIREAAEDHRGSRKTHFERCYAYISQRITGDGHFNLWTKNPILAKRRERFEKEFLDHEHSRQVYREAYERLKEGGELEKIQTYYEDF